MSSRLEGIFVGQLHAFVEVARLENVTRAASALFLTQPALTSRLNRLERELGTTLLLRNRKGAKLTEAGRILLPYAERILASMADVERLLVDASPMSEEVSIAATATLSTYVLPAVVKTFVADHPNVRLTLHTAASEAILEDLLASKVQMGLGRSLQHPDIECTLLYEEDYALVVDSAHPWATRRNVEVADFRNEILVLFNRSPSYHEFVSSLLHHDNVRPRGIIDVDDSETGKRMVRERIGPALLPLTAVSAEIAAGTLHRVSVRDLEPMRRQMAAMRLKGAPELTLLNEFQRALTSTLRKMGLAVPGGRGGQARPSAHSSRR